MNDERKRKIIDSETPFNEIDLDGVKGNIESTITTHLPNLPDYNWRPGGRCNNKISRTSM
jgi:hypothetical protein